MAKPAKVHGYVKFDGGEIVCFTAEGLSSYPDELRELKRTVVDAITECAAVVLGVAVVQPAAEPVLEEPSE